MLRKQLLILFITFCSQQSSCFIDDLFKLAENGMKFINFDNDVGSTKATALDFASMITGGDEQMHKVIIEKLERIDDEIKALHANRSDNANDTEALVNILLDEFEIRYTNGELLAFIAMTDQKWNSLSTYLRRETAKEVYDSFTDSIILSIGENLMEFRDRIASDTMTHIFDLGFWSLLARHGHHKTYTLCNEGETYHHVIVRFYQMAIITEVKAHVLLSFAKRFKFSNGDVWKRPIEELKESFTEQFGAYIHEFSRSLANPELPYIRACDPKSSWRYGDDFIALDGFIQQTVYRDVDTFDKRPPPGSVPVSPGSSYWIYPPAPHLGCGGEISDCVSLSYAFADTEVCIWNDGPHRIRFINENGVTRGIEKDKPCPTDHMFVDCRSVVLPEDECPLHFYNYQSCRCIAPKWKIVNQLMSSRVEDNYVIVGMRFSKILNYVYIQIAEGKLESNGYISNFSWVPATREPLQSSYLTTMDVDKHRRAFFFDNLQLPSGYLLTGIQMISAIRNNIEGFTIRLHGVKFDYGTGKVDSRNRANIMRLLATASREFTYKPKRSTTMQPYEPQSLDSEGYTHIYLQQSDFDDDYGQSTLPFLDSVPIVTRPLAPIGGVGLFHKGHKDYAGFLSLRLYPIDYLYFAKTFVEMHNLTSPSTWNDA